MTHVDDARDILRGFIASFFGFGGRLIARAILIIFAGRAFGMEALGHLGQVAAISEITAAVCVMGLKRSLLDMMSYDTERGRPVERRMVEALSLAALIGVTVGGALCFVWIRIFPDSAALIPALFLTVPAIVLTDVCLTTVKFKRVIRWDVWARCIIEPWAFLGLAGLLWFFGLKDQGLLFAYAGSTIAACICAITGLIAVSGFRNLVTSQPNFRTWPGIIKRSVPVGITDVGVMSLRRLDLIVLSLFVGPATLGLYYAAQQVVTIPQKVCALFEPMLSPVIAKLHNQKNNVQIRDTLLSICRWVFILQLAISIPIIIFGDMILSLFGSEFSAAAMVLAIIVVAELIDGTFLSVETPLVYAKPRIPPTLLILTLIILIAAIAALSPTWGAEGAAIGFLIAMVFLTTARLMMLKRHLGISILNTSYYVPAITGILMGFGLWTLRTLPINSATMNITGIIFSLAIFAFIIKTFALTQSDRDLIGAMSRKKKTAVS